MNIIMLGAQGTGKGTVAGLISEGIGLPQISTGDIFRKNISEKTELGIEADRYISQGNLVPDTITVPMVEDRLTWEDAKNGAILDGFPRTIEQAQKLDEILQSKNEKVDLVINLVTPKEELIDRMITRRVCTNPDCKTTYNTKLHPPKVEGICDDCKTPLTVRGDDNEESFKVRFDTYVQNTLPIIEYYKDLNKLVEIDVNKKDLNLKEKLMEILSD